MGQYISRGSASNLAELEYDAGIIFSQEASHEKNRPHVHNMNDNSIHEFNYEPKFLPTDDQGYVVSFNYDNDSFKEFFDEYGVVVIDGILTGQECERSVDELWEFMERHCPDLDRNNPETWHNWLSLEKFGILGNMPILSKQFFENRQNTKLYNVYSKLLNTNKLWSNIGRGSIIRPTINVRTNNEYRDYPEWKTELKWLHLDMDPITGAQTTFMYHEHNPQLNIGFDNIGLQGTIALSDCGINDGGFLCVPGFHKHIRDFSKHLSNNYHQHKQNFGVNNAQYFFPNDDAIYEYAQKVPVRAGSTIIWSSAIPHSTFPNNSSNPRQVQYVHMVDVDKCSKYLEPILNDKKFLPKNFKLSNLGSKLLGFKNW